MRKPQVHNAMELEALVQQMGFLPFFSCLVPNFSIEEFTPGCYWFVDGVDGPWEWKMELARQGVVAYGKLFSKKAGLVSREWYPDLANYRRDGYNFDARYEEGLTSYREKCVMDVLLREGPTLSKDLKRLAGFGGDGLAEARVVETGRMLIKYLKASARCKVEQVLRMINCRFGYKKTAYRGLRKNMNPLYIVCIFAYFMQHVRL